MNNTSSANPDQTPKEIEKFVTLGKVQAVERVDESQIVQKQKKESKKREGGGMYEEDTTLTIEI